MEAELEKAEAEIKRLKGLLGRYGRNVGGHEGVAFTEQGYRMFITDAEAAEIDGLINMALDYDDRPGTV